MMPRRPIEVAIVGGGCASMAAAFELTRPEHRRKYHVTVYQVGWRLGGKGASGRGPAQRIEEHGLHLWMGYYENAFQMLRECYAELNRDPASQRFADWRDALYPDPFVTLADDAPDGSWRMWTACFPTNDELPGDPRSRREPPGLNQYLLRSCELLRSLLASASPATDFGAHDERRSRHEFRSLGQLETSVQRLISYGRLATSAAFVEALRVLEAGLRLLPGRGAPLLLRLVDLIDRSARRMLEDLLETNDELRRLWAVADMWLAILRGVLRFGLLADPRGLDAIDDFDFRDWLRHNGASERTLRGTFIRSLYDLAFSYENGDPRKARIAAGQGLRTLFRMFFTYRGSLFWKMRAGMGDVVFAPLYEVLKKRGVSFRFFHRLENVRLADPQDLEPGERPYVCALDFDVQAETVDGEEYRPLINVDGLPCWPSEPLWDQLEDGERMQSEAWRLESHWDRRRKGTKTLRVVDDFDFVVLGVSLGAIPFVCSEVLKRDARWRAMVDHIGTIATQSFQVWLHADMDDLGWHGPPTNLSGFVEPFDTWADMRQLLTQEDWPRPSPRGIAYFCSVLHTPEGIPDRSDTAYPASKHEEVRRHAVRFLNRDVAAIWPHAGTPEGGFRWHLLADPQGEPALADERSGERRFETQFWKANVDPSDRYVLSLPGTQRFRISPLDNTYDNLTLAGDWTDCGYNQGCVEAAIMSGRLAAHAIAGYPRLEDIFGYDHP